VFWLALVSFGIVWWAKRKARAEEVPTLAPSPRNKTGLHTSVPTSAAVDIPIEADPPRVIGDSDRAPGSGLREPSALHDSALSAIKL
jgi:hypothetical protein